ncbi:MAG TPA: TonB family protein [Leptolyngbyaceae cyanobacterium]
MSISSFCIEQREKEKAALKSLLTYSVAGSAALHLALAFGIALIWPKQPSLADDPIELIVIDAPEPEVIKPPEKAPEPLPTPKAQPVVTPPPQKPVATITPEPIFTPPPLKEVEPPKPLMPEPVPQPMEKPVATITPEPIPTPAPPKPLMPESLPQPTEEVKTPPLREPLPPPKVSQPTTPNNPPIREKPLQTPSVNSQPFQNSFAEPRPTQTANEETPNLPGGLTGNQQPPSNNSTVTSQPLQSSAPDNRTFRENFTTANNTPLGGNPSDDNSLTTAGIPGDVTTSPEAAPNQPMVTSQPLQSSSNSGNREFRDSFSSASNAGPDVLSGDTSSSIPGVPGGVTANRQPTSRPLANSQPLSGSGSGSANRGFRDSFSSASNGGPDASSGDTSSSIPGVPGGVTANRQPTSRPLANSQPLSGSGSGSANRGFRDSFANSNSGTGSSGSNPDADFSGGIPGGTSQGVAANQGVPPKPGGSGQGTQGTGRGRRVARRGSASGVRCIRECQPQYPSHLEDAEGRPEVRFTIESDGSTTDPELAQTSGNTDLDQAAVEAVRKMQFAPPTDGPVSVRIGINFVASGSRFERQARERREENDRQRRERERQQQQLESIEPENSTSN